ncbi:MAG TPA: nucleotidyltransferase domain-containing protein [Prolixibacteraceae bacterium]|nr:nucleotidyltransferase domain-containing protein [Prolixibacteraceae bacterium]HPS11879.1 nucleotidyltransferase domain-containing protein [Prolixibacteraceae bacterium]
MLNECEYGIEKSDWQNVIRVFNNNQHIEKAILFGSRAKGTYHEGSDIDIALQGSNLAVNDILDLTNEMEALNLPYKFDLIIYHRIKEPNLADHINRIGKVIFER